MPLRLVLCVPLALASPFDHALLEDMMPAPSARCIAGFKNSTFSSTFAFPGSDPKSEWSAPYVNKEKDVFLAQMQHVDKNTNRSWRLRVGHGSNTYSFTGAYGEAMPPQEHELAPWIDEVWQMVAVDQDKNKQKAYFIHQAGTYQSENILKKKAFYSPNVAKHCSKETGTCIFASWGQHAHVAAEWTSPMLYYTRYQDCGDGVVEVTWLMHNMGKTGGVPADTAEYLNVPWGGVRTSTLRDIVISSKGGEKEMLTPLAGWGQPGQVIKNLNTFGGYSAFAEALPLPAKRVNMPAGLKLVRNGGCSASASHLDQTGKLTLKMQLKQTEIVKTGEGNTFMLTNSQGEGMVVVGVLHWAWAGNSMYFHPQEKNSNTAVAQCNALFKNGGEMTLGLAQGLGKRKDDNLGLAFVHGSEASGSFEGDSNWQKKQRSCRVRIGGTNAKRNYNVWTINSFTQVKPGSTYSYRQNIITDSFATGSAEGGLESRASSWAKEPSQRYLSNMATSKNAIGRAVGICSCSKSSNLFSLAAASSSTSKPVCGSDTMTCEGRTTPHGDATEALFAITCGAKRYVGFDRYHFKPVEEKGEQEVIVASGFKILPRRCSESAHHTKTTGKLTLRMIMHGTTTVKSGYKTPVKFVNAKGELAVNDVIHWGWAGQYLYFHPTEQNAAKAIAQCTALNGKDVKVMAPAPSSSGKDYKRPYAECSSDSDGLPVYPMWKLLGFFKPSACASFTADAKVSVDACPSPAPTPFPTEAPTAEIVSPAPTHAPTRAPTKIPTNSPTSAPTLAAGEMKFTVGLSNSKLSTQEALGKSIAAIFGVDESAVRLKMASSPPTPSPTSAPTPKPTNPPLPVFVPDDPVFDKSKFTVAIELPASLPPSASPTAMPTSAGFTVVQQEKQVTAVKAVLPFTMSAEEIKSPAVKLSLVEGVARALGFPVNDVRIVAINGVAVDNGSSRRLSGTEAVDVTFEIISQSTELSEVQAVEANVATAATTGAIIANVQKAASENGALTQTLADMNRVLPTPEVEVVTLTVMETVEVPVPTPSPTHPPTEENVYIPSPLAITSTRTVPNQHKNATLTIQEGEDFTTTCSHVRCQMKENGIHVQHHHAEEYGHQHVCKNGMHTEGKCGCECYDEGYGMSEFAAAILDLHTKDDTQRRRLTSDPIQCGNVFCTQDMCPNGRPRMKIGDKCCACAAPLTKFDITVTFATMDKLVCDGPNALNGPTCLLSLVRNQGSFSKKLATEMIKYGVSSSEAHLSVVDDTTVTFLDPTITQFPTPAPSTAPTKLPTAMPTNSPTKQPTNTPTVAPTNTGSVDAKSCTLNAGKATCSTTVTWTSSSPSACIYLQPSGNLFACGQSGSKVVSWITARPKNFVMYESRSPASLQLGSADGVRALQAPKSAKPTALPTTAPTNGGPTFSFDTLLPFFHSQNLTGKFSDDALKAIAKIPMVTIEKGHGGMWNKGGSWDGARDGRDMAEVKVTEACRRIKAAGKAEGTNPMAIYYWNGMHNWYHFDSADKWKTHPDWFLKKPDGSYVTKVDAGMSGKTLYFDFRVPEVKTMWKDHCLAAVREGCDGCFIDNSQHMGFYMKLTSSKWAGLSDAEARKWEQGHTDALNELNDELKDLGKIAINNNVGKGITTATAVMIENFGPSEKCMQVLQGYEKRGLIVQAHAGSKNAKTKQTCTDGDTNTMAVFMLGMGKDMYYQCSEFFWSDLSAGDHFSGKEHWTATKGHDDWLNWRKEMTYPLGLPQGAPTKNGNIWSRSFKSGTRVTWNAVTRQGEISWANGIVQKGADLTSSVAVLNKQKFCGNHRDGLTNINMGNGNY